MQLYKASILLKSSIITALKGDTIWGHVVWGIANHLGEEEVENFLKSAKNGEPTFIISSAFPKGCICKPFPKHIDRVLDMKTSDYAKIKKNKKLKYVSANDYIKSSAKIENEVQGNPFESVSVMHNSINRFSNVVEEGALYAVNELWSKNAEFDLYIASTYEQSKVKELLDWAFENGYGADSSVGKGVIEVQNVEKVEVKQNTNTYVALAPFVTDFSNIEKESLRSDTFIRTGKIGGAFATSMSPYKKTVILYDEGAVFKSDKPLSYIGNIITNVHSDSRICQSGFAPVVPISE